MEEKAEISSPGRIMAWLFLLPALVIFTALVWLPFLKTIHLSFIDWDILTPAKWIGLENFIKLLGLHQEGGQVVANDPLFWKYVGNTLFMGLGTSLPFFLLPLLIAFLVRNADRKKQIAFGLLYMIPVAFLISPMSFYMIWRWLFNPDFGLINVFLAKFGIDGPDWLSSTAWAKPARILMSTVQISPAWIALGLVLYLAAWRGKSFRTAVVFMLILVVISSLGGFGPSYIMTGGGPAGATTTIMYYTYNNCYQWFKLGYASAILVPIILFLFLLGIVIWRITEKRKLKIVLLEREKEKESSQPWPYLFLIPLTFIIILLAIIPLIWAFGTSVKAPGEIFTYPPRFFPEVFHWENFAKAWQAVPYGRFYFNTIFKTVCISISQVLIALLAAYSLSVLKVPGRRALFFLFATTMLLSPGTHLRLLVFAWIKKMPEFLNWIFHTTFWSTPLYIGRFLVGPPVGIDSYFALIVPCLAWGLGIFLFKLFFDGLEPALSEARKMEASEWNIFWNIALPKSRPIIALTLVISSFFAWSEFLWPLVVTKSMEMKTLTVGIASFQGLYTTDWPLLMAGSLIAMVPPMIVLLFSLWLLQIFVFPRLTIVGDEDKE